MLCCLAHFILKMLFLTTFCNKLEINILPKCKGVNFVDTLEMIRNNYFITHYILSTIFVVFLLILEKFSQYRIFWEEWGWLDCVTGLQSGCVSEGNVKRKKKRTGHFQLSNAVKGTILKAKYISELQKACNKYFKCS